MIWLSLETQDKEICHSVNFSSSGKPGQVYGMVMTNMYHDICADIKKACMQCIMSQYIESEALYTNNHTSCTLLHQHIATLHAVWNNSLLEA